MAKNTFKKRKYIRINSVLPVEFYLINDKGKRGTPYLQGFTHNIGKGGIYLEINDLWQGFSGRFNEGEKVGLNVEIPFKKETEVNYGRIVWKESVKKGRFTQYRLGIEFERECLDSARKLFLYALTRKAVPYVISIFIIILFAVSFNEWFSQERLKRENRNLIKSYHRSIYESELLRRNIQREKSFGEFLREKEKQTGARVRDLKKEITMWKKKYMDYLKENKTAKASSIQLEDTIHSLEGRLLSLEAENSKLKQEISRSKRTASALTNTLKKADRSLSRINPKIIEGMYSWIKNRQDLHSGLVLSYEGDESLRDTAFSYDESLAAITFCLFGDNQRARKVLDFYAERTRGDKPIYNAYYTNGDVYEYTVSSGVNAWVGLAALYYTRATGDKRYLPLIEYVSRMLFGVMDKEGGIRGSPAAKWYSTEHNLDSYAFFHAFYRVSGKKKYLETAKKIEKWLSRYAYTNVTVPVNRGKGDATIATDTYAWSITALGPEELFSLGSDANEIIDFSIKNCEVQAPFKRRDGIIEVQGFDFARARDIARGGIISCEWTAQMVLAFEIMADYYYGKDNEKFHSYQNKALFYTRELGKMIINSPSPAGKDDPVLPYASAANVDTGHGWRTPKGNQTGSLSATAYFLIAYKGVNPLNP